MGISIDKIRTVHEGVKKVRAPIWAKENQSSPEKYNLFMDNSKQVLNYIRVTNIRGNKSDVALKDNGLFEKYKTICAEYLRTKKRPRTIEIQQIPNALLLDTGYGIGELDDGLVYIGTNFCLNHENPKCKDCPVNALCEGCINNSDLIQNYRT